MKMRFSLGAGAIVAALLMAGSASAATFAVGASTFAADTTGSVTGDFTGVPTPFCTGSSCFGGANPLAGYASLSGVSFSTPNLNGNVNVNNAFYNGPTDLGVPYLVNSVFDGPGDDTITITLPTAATAFALDFGSLFSSTTATFTLSNGFSTVITNTAISANGATQFLGFLSDQAFDTITVSVLGHDSIVIADFETATLAAVPEPSTWALMLVGVAGAGLALRRRSAKATLA